MPLCVCVWMVLGQATGEENKSQPAEKQQNESIFLYNRSPGG